MRPIRPAIITRPVRITAACAVTTLLCACSASPYPDASQRPPDQIAPISTGLNALADGASPQAAADPDRPAAPSAWEQAALDLQQVLNDQSSTPAQPDMAQPDAIEHNPATPSEPTPDPSASSATSQPRILATNTPPAQADQPSTAASIPPVSDRTADATTTLAQQAARLADALRAAAGTSDDPAREIVRAAVVLGLWPGLSPAPSPVTLAPAEQTRADVASRLAGALASPGISTPALLDALAQARTDLASDGSGFAIAHAQLARRVWGYGKYDPFPAHTFLAGKPNRLIVYTEPANFGHRPPTASDPATSATARWVVDLSQELTLYHEASADLQAWHRPKARVVDASRNRQRDYYLINEIVLPANLSVGSYRLKIATTDETTGAQAEASITIHLVADPALAYGNR